MPQTKLGAMKVRASKVGLPLDVYQSLIVSGQKWCCVCKDFHERSEFGLDATRGDGMAARCLKSKRVVVRVNTKGRLSPMKGRRFSPEARLKMGRPVGFASDFKGIPRSVEVRKKISEVVRVRAVRGEQCHSYKDGKHVERVGERFTNEYKQWRYDVYLRDKFTCQVCLDSRGGNLHAHHIFGFAEFPELRLCVANGLTVCEDCHKEIHYGI